MVICDGWCFDTREAACATIRLYNMWNRRPQFAAHALKKKKRDTIKNLDWIFKSTESDEVNLCLWSLRLFLITEEDCDFHPAAIFPPHVQNVLFLTVVSLFFSPLSTDRCSFRRSSSFVCLRHGRRTTEALCRTSIRSETPALNFRWDSTIPLNAEFRIRCNLCLKKKISF